MRSSYRTYEEWKQYVPKRFKISWNGSYRTYEEWKLEFVLRLGGDDYLSSYRTYEEWKLTSHSLKRIDIIVLTVPMRNGNSSSFGALSFQRLVLTVPMRNGNFFPG